MERERKIDSKRSCPSSCWARLISVSVTVRAFFDRHRVRTMTRPAKRSSGVSEWTFCASAPMVAVRGWALARAAL